MIKTEFYKANVIVIAIIHSAFQGYNDRAKGGIEIRQARKILASFIVIALIASPAALAADLPDTLVPMGNVVGISALIDGAMVVETMENSAAEKAGIIEGDVIIKVGDEDVDDGEDIEEALEGCSGPVTVTVSREGQELTMEVTPEGGKLGVWLRDGIDGIGTVTYYDPASSTFGALGHSINDTDTGRMLPTTNGSITNALVTGIMAGKSGSPGQLQGMPDFENVLGSVSKNTRKGIFGLVTQADFTAGRQEYPIARAGDVKTGEAVIFSDAVDGVMREYTVEISRLFTGIVSGGRDMMITVTDKRLLEATGGIVQGMSGSPIIQDGMFVGAVTHVLVNEPDKGYGIFIENMVEAA